jgi:hypothetical protein
MSLPDSCKTAIPTASVAPAQDALPTRFCPSAPTCPVCDQHSRCLSGRGVAALGSMECLGAVEPFSITFLRRVAAVFADRVAERCLAAEAAIRDVGKIRPLARCCQRDVIVTKI